MPVSRVVDVAPERVVKWATGFAARHGQFDVETSDDGATLRAADGAVAVLSVPFPPLAAPTAGTWLEAIATHAARPRRIGILLVRLGGYAVGVFDNGELVASKVGARPVHGRSAAGGWSQQRFARRREGQARVALTAAADAAAAILLPQRESLDAVVRGGDRRALHDVLDDQRLGVLAGMVVSRVLDVPDPKGAVLRASHAAAVAVKVTVSDP